MRELVVVLAASSVALVSVGGVGCAGPCKDVAAVRGQLALRPAPALEPPARVRVPFAAANREIAEVLVEPPSVPVSLRRLGPLRRVVGELHVVPRSVRLGPAAPGRVRIDVTVELRN